MTEGRIGAALVRILSPASPLTPRPWENETALRIVGSDLVSTHPPLRQRGELRLGLPDSRVAKFQPTPRFVSEGNR